MTGVRSSDWFGDVVDLAEVRASRRREAIRKAVQSNHPCAQNVPAELFDNDDEGEAS